MSNATTDMTTIVEWMRANPRAGGHELYDLARQFSESPDRLRDRLRRLVDQGILTQSRPIAGFADNNPSFDLRDTASSA